MFLKTSNLFSDNRKNSSLSIIGEGIELSGEINTLLISLSCTASIKSLYLKVLVAFSVFGLSKTEVPIKMTVITARTYSPTFLQRLFTIINLRINL